MSAVLEQHGSLPLAPLCAALGVSRATVNRRLRPAPPAAPRPRPSRALDDDEKQAVLDELCSERFVDRSPAEVVHTLLKERRDQLRHPKHARPELVATKPNDVWSWDITKLRTTAKWSYLNLYVLLDIFSRCVVGWMIAREENAIHARRLIEQSVDKHGVEPGELVLHSDRGAPMTSKTLAQLLADLDVARSLSRPRVSNDNPFSESQFKTAKYHPSYPGKFATLDDALSWGREFFPWYNDDHKHSGIAFLSPADVFYGRADEVLARKHSALLEAYRAHPERFTHGPPRRPRLPPATYINPPSSSAEPVEARSEADTCDAAPPDGLRPATESPGPEWPTAEVH